MIINIKILYASLLGLLLIAMQGCALLPDPNSKGEWNSYKTIDSNLKEGSKLVFFGYCDENTKKGKGEGFLLNISGEKQWMTDNK